MLLPYPRSSSPCFTSASSLKIDCMCRSIRELHKMLTIPYLLTKGTESVARRLKIESSLLALAETLTVLLSHTAQFSKVFANCSKRRLFSSKGSSPATKRYPETIYFQKLMTRQVFRFLNGGRKKPDRFAYDRDFTPQNGHFAVDKCG